MLPVTAADVARLAEGKINDAAEEHRIFAAILNDPDLGQLYSLLTDDMDTPDTPDTGEASETDILSHVKSRQQLQTQARLCRIEGSLPLAGNPREVIRRLFWQHDTPPASCRFTPLDDQPGRYRVHVPLPAHCRVLSLVAADVVWGREPFLARIHVDRSWTSQTPTSNDTKNNPKLTTLPPHAADTTAPSRFPLAAETRSDLPASLRLPVTELLSELVALQVRSTPPRAAHVELKTLPPVPRPILLTARSEDGTLLDSEIRVLHNSSQVLPNLFSSCTAPIAWLEVAPLMNTETARLTPRQATELIGAVNYAVRSMEPIENHPGEYTVDLHDTDMQNRLASHDLVIGLQIAVLEQEVHA